MRSRRYQAESLASQIVRSPSCQTLTVAHSVQNPEPAATAATTTTCWASSAKRLWTCARFFKSSSQQRFR